MSTPRQHIVVMKFGGTSVEDSAAMQRTAHRRGPRAQGLNPIVVVSAMSKVTDTLLKASAAAGRNAREEALRLSDGLRTRHLKTAGELVTGDRLTSLQLNIHHDFDALDDLLRGISAVGELTPRTADHVVSFGERLSSDHRRGLRRAVAARRSRRRAHRHPHRRPLRQGHAERARH
jgi:aspartate kinase